MQKGFDVAVPLEFPSVMEEAAKSTGRSVYRFYRCTNDNSDKKARELAAAQPFLNDGIVLALNALEIIAKSYMTLGRFLESIPELATENRFLKVDCPPQRILGKLSENGGGISEGIFMGEEGNRVLVRSNRRGDGLYMYAESFSQESAKALCDDIEKKIREIMKK